MATSLSRTLGASRPSSLSAPAVNPRTGVKQSWTLGRSVLIQSLCVLIGVALLTGSAMQLLAARAGFFFPWSVTTTIAGAVGGVCTVLCTLLRIPIVIALPCAGLYVCHPWLAGGYFNPASTITSTLAMVVALLVLTASGSSLSVRKPARVLGLGLALGLAFLVDSVGAPILAVLALCVGLCRREGTSPKSGAVQIWAMGLGLGLLLALTAFSLGMTPSPRSTWRLSSSAAASTNTPLAWVDRTGDLSHRLHNLPVDLRCDGSRYLGWGVIGLILVGLLACKRSGLPDPDVQLVALLVFSAMWVLWLQEGPSGLHARLVELFQYATVRRRVDTATLNWLGLTMLPFLALPVCMFLACIRVAGPRAGRGLLVILSASFAVMVWFSVASESLLPRTWLDRIVASAIVEALVIFGLIAGVAMGWTVLNKIKGSRFMRVIAWTVVAVVLAVDVHPYIANSVDRILLPRVISGVLQ